MNEKEIIEIFDSLKEATINFWLASKKEDEAKLAKTAAYKQLQLARGEASTIKFNN